VIHDSSAADGCIGGQGQVSPREGNAHEPGFVVPVCVVCRATHRVREVDLHPTTWSRTHRATTGFPAVARGTAATAVLDRMAELSAPYGTKIIVSDGLGRVVI
jgi:hypothetical protein